MSTDRELLNVSAAARRVDLPRTTVAAWVRRGRLHPVGLDVDHTPLYDLEHVRALAVRRRRRRPATPKGNP